MDTKLLTGAGGLLLLAATILPSALGHDERPALAIPYGGDPDGVSGRYVGAAGPALAVEAGNQSHPAYNVLPVGALLCDMEVFADSNSLDGEANEENVDGSPTVGDRDDSFDDGGFGGACHTNHYVTSGFNTPGCQGGQTARASNGATDVFIGAACDWMSQQSGSGPDQTLVLCLVNGALAFDAYAPPMEESQVFVDCVEEFVEESADCIIQGCVDPYPWCGADGTLDAMDFGYGSGSLNPAIFPSVTGPLFCPLEDQAAAIYVFDTVATNGGSLVDPDGVGPLDPVYVPGIVNVYPAFAGELWTDL